jgi:transcriptional regulator with XRE-family HTH domain
MKILGKRLKEARIKAGYTQIEASKKLGISNGTLSGYERNYRDPDTETLNEMAKLYNVNVDYLLGNTDKPHLETREERAIYNIDESIEKLLEDPEFMIAYKEMPGTPEEAKKELIRFMKYLKYEEEKKKKK